MATDQHDADDEGEVLPVPLDAETIKLLARFGRAVGKHPTRVAGELLRDLLRDDAEAHGLRLN